MNEILKDILAMTNWKSAHARRKELADWLEANPSAAIREVFDPERPGVYSPITKQRLSHTIVVEFTNFSQFDKLGLLGPTAGIRRIGKTTAPFFAINLEQLHIQMANPYFAEKILADIRASVANSTLKVVEVLGLMDPKYGDKAFIRLRPDALLDLTPLQSLTNSGFTFHPYSPKDQLRFVVERNGERGVDLVQELLGNAAFGIAYAQASLKFAPSCKNDLTEALKRLAATDFQPFVQRNQIWIDEINLPEVWKALDAQHGGNPDWLSTPGGKIPIGIAVLDAVLDLAHPALWRVYRGGIDFTGGPVESYDDQVRRFRHGTSCAGLIAGFDESTRFRGVAAGCGVFSARVAAGEPSEFLSPDETKTYAFSPTEYNLEAMRKAIYACLFHKDAKFGRVDVVSMSLGVPGWSQESAKYAPLAKAIRHALSHGRDGRGCVIVAAAGNDNGGQTVNFPAALEGVVAVASAARRGLLLTPDTCVKAYENPGFPPCTQSCMQPALCAAHNPLGYPGSCYLPEDTVTLAAPGLGLWSTDSSDDGDIAAGSTVGNYALFGATSGAVPIVAGAAALILAKFPELHSCQVVDILKKSAKKYPMRNCRRWTPPEMQEMQFGFLDVAGALRLAGETVPIPTLNPASEDLRQTIGKEFGWISESGQATGSSGSHWSPP